MKWHSQSPEVPRLIVRPVCHSYRYCPRCRKEVVAKYQSCPECVHWLGEKPLNRIEWQLSPAKVAISTPSGYELIGASALNLRLVCNETPTGKVIAELAEVIGEIVSIANSTACEVAGLGWLIWTTEGLRRAFRLGCDLEHRLVTSLPRLQRVVLGTADIRWGIWIDQYIVQFGRDDAPIIKDDTAKAIFNFEPDGIVHSSSTIYQTNRRWEHFVSVPRRLLDGQEPCGYRMIGHKRPSALDHAEAGHTTPFVGRDRQLSILEDCWKPGGPSVKLAITAPAGSGKTRLIKEWLKRHPVRALTANFSLFGGAVEEFVSQLAELPPDRLDIGALADAVLGRIQRERMAALIIDDLHWAGSDGLAFVHHLITKLPRTGMLIILSARPSGQQCLNVLHPDRELKLDPLPSAAAEELAHHLSMSETVAAEAASRSNGNPLFVEQFAAWAAETKFRSGKTGPRNLHQIIAARIEYLLKVRIADIRQQLQWGGLWRRTIDDELRQLELEIGLWLDRLETGDYADRLEATRYLVRLECLDYEIFVISTVAGRPRPRSSRLREAIERLLIGSAEQVLADLKRRATGATSATKENISHEARRAADILFAAFNWTLAGDFYELARSCASHDYDQNEIDRRLAECRCRGRKTIANDSEVFSAYPLWSLVERPSVDALQLPYVWADLGRRFRHSAYFARAGEAAEAIKDYALAAWAKRKAANLLVNESHI